MSLADTTVVFGIIRLVRLEQVADAVTASGLRETAPKKIGRRPKICQNNRVSRVMIVAMSASALPRRSRQDAVP
jgi:hypothetical protein